MYAPQLYSLQLADLGNEEHCKHIIALVNEYRCDSMGGTIGVLSKDGEQRLIDGLRKHPCSVVYFAIYDKSIAGMAVCFIGFSTFKAKRLINIHDIIIYTEFRRKGIASFILQEISSIYAHEEYCKLTLEVRTDNYSAKRLYFNSGLGPCEPPMEFWVKEF